MNILEIRIRTFFTCDSCDIAPSIVMTLRDDQLTRNDWPAILNKAAESLSELAKEAPAGDLRPMTHEEVRTYQKSENDETPGFVSLARREANEAE